MISISQSHAVMDCEIALRRLGGDETLLKTLIGFFIEDGPTLLSELQQAMEAGDWPVVALKAHSLKGLSSTFEAIPFMQLAATVESQATSADQIHLIETIPQLQAEFERLLSELKSFTS